MKVRLKMAKMTKIEITESKLSSVTAEKNPFSYVAKCKGHLNRAFSQLSETIPELETRIVFAPDNKSVEIDLSVVSEIAVALDNSTEENKRLISHAKTSLNNILYGKTAGGNFKKVW